MRIPSSPAPPKSRAHQLHSEEAMTPRETRVSIVVEPWRPAAKAALWNGHAPQVVTGIEARATTHCHPLNCRGGAIDKTRARIAKGAEIRRRCSRLSARSRAPSPTPGEEAFVEGVVSEIAFGKEVLTERRDGEEGACEPVLGEAVACEPVLGEAVAAKFALAKGVPVGSAFGD